MKPISNEAFRNAVGGNRKLGGLVPLVMLVGVIMALLGVVYLIVTGKQRNAQEEKNQVMMKTWKRKKRSVVLIVIILCGSKQNHLPQML